MIPLLASCFVEVGLGQEMYVGMSILRAKLVLLTTLHSRSSSGQSKDGVLVLEECCFICSHRRCISGVDP